MSMNAQPADGMRSLPDSAYRRFTAVSVVRKPVAGSTGFPISGLYKTPIGPAGERDHLPLFSQSDCGSLPRVCAFPHRRKSKEEHPRRTGTDLRVKPFAERLIPCAGKPAQERAVQFQIVRGRNDSELAKTVLVTECDLCRRSLHGKNGRHSTNASVDSDDRHLLQKMLTWHWLQAFSVHSPVCCSSFMPNPCVIHNILIYRLFTIACRGS